MAETMAEGGKGVLSSFTTKVGPLPLWAWTAVPAGAFVIYSYWKSRQTPDGPPLVYEDGLEGDEGAQDEYLNTGLPSVGSGQIVPKGTNLNGWQVAPDGSSNMPETNDTWYQKALAYLTGQGANALQSSTALSAYIYGFPNAISESQAVLIERAVKGVGAPPSASYLPTVTKPATPDTPGTTKPPATVKTTKPGSVKGLKVVNNTVQWQAGSTGGSPITGYRVDIYMGKNVWRPITPSASWYATIPTGLAKKGTKTSVRVAAVNKNGTGPFSTATVSLP